MLETRRTLRVLQGLNNSVSNSKQDQSFRCPASSYSNSISKVKQACPEQRRRGGDERATKTVQVARLGVSEEANTVSLMKWNWNYLCISAYGMEWS